MDVVELNSSSAEEFISRQPVSAILYFTPLDRGMDAILTTLSEVARSFEEQIGFGKVDLAATANLKLVRDGIVVVTPTMIYYRFGVPCGENVGLDEIVKWLDHDSIVHLYGHTDTWLRILR